MATNNKNTNFPPITYNRQKTKWATFTYYGPDTIITKLFKNNNIKTAFKTTNTIRNHAK
jgi:hypothetical protein